MDRVTSIKLILGLDTSFPIAQNNASYYELTNKIGIRCAVVSCFYFSLNVMMDGEDTYRVKLDICGILSNSSFFFRLD